MDLDLPNPAQVIFHHIGRVLPRVGWAMHEHSHTGFHELIVIVRGTIETRISGQTLIGSRGDTLLYPQDIPHAERAVGPEPLEIIFIGWMGPLNASTGAAQTPLKVNDRTGRIQMLVEWIAESSTACSSGAIRPQDLLLNALLIEFSRLAQPVEQARVQKIRDFIRRHLSEPIDLERMAREVGLSKYHFNREYKHHAGETPMQTLRSERVAAARSLLLSTPWKLSAIALQVGFSDEFQLSRVFKRVTGISPGKVRG